MLNIHQGLCTVLRGEKQTVGDHWDFFRLHVILLSPFLMSESLDGKLSQYSVRPWRATC